MNNLILRMQIFHFKTNENVQVICTQYKYVL